jgi:hypothetical protein
MGLHICQINPRGTDERGEWLSVANDGPSAVALTGLEITDFTRTQQHVHVYTFPPAQGGDALLLRPQETAYVFTGPGRSERLADGDLLLFAGRYAPVWNNSGDVAYLRNARGEFIDWMDVGAPARHPNGHRRHYAA